jgi:hypothetical protein
MLTQCPELLTLATMKPIALLCLLCFVTGCYSAAPPPPYPVQPYPVTWTPAPTPTQTLPGPTATRVIQITPGALPTRASNARVLPTVPRGNLGVWMDINATAPQADPDLLARAAIVVTDGSAAIARQANPFLFLTTDQAAVKNLAPDVNGIILARGAADNPTAFAALREQIKPRVVLASAAVTDTQYIAQVLPNVDGILLENFARDADAPMEQFPDEAAWRQNIDALAGLSTNPDTIILTSTRFPEAADRPLPLVQQWANFALASFLLAANNTHAFFGMPDPHVQQFMNVPALNVQLGLPFGGMVKTNGVYQRRFVRGLVLVNPSNAKRILNLARAYQNALGEKFTALEIEPHTGLVLLNAE